jgi:hypothetical protein
MKSISVILRNGSLVITPSLVAVFAAAFPMVAPCFARKPTSDLNPENADLLRGFLHVERSSVSATIKQISGKRMRTSRRLAVYVHFRVCWICTYA